VKSNASQRLGTATSHASDINAKKHRLKRRSQPLAHGEGRRARLQRLPLVVAARCTRHRRSTMASQYATTSRRGSRSDVADNSSSIQFGNNSNNDAWVESERARLLPPPPRVAPAPSRLLSTSSPGSPLHRRSQRKSAPTFSRGGSRSRSSSGGGGAGGACTTHAAAAPFDYYYTDSSPMAAASGYLPFYEQQQQQHAAGLRHSSSGNGARSRRTSGPAAALGRAASAALPLSIAAAELSTPRACTMHNHHHHHSSSPNSSSSDINMSAIPGCRGFVSCGGAAFECVAGLVDSPRLPPPDAKLWTPARVTGLLVLVALSLVGLRYATPGNIHAVVQVMRAHPGVSLVAYMLVFVVGIILMLPGMLFSVAAGSAFGFALGAAVAFLSTIIGELGVGLDGRVVGWMVALVGC